MVGRNLSRPTVLTDKVEVFVLYVYGTTTIKWQRYADKITLRINAYANPPTLFFHVEEQIIMVPLPQRPDLHIHTHRKTENHVECMKHVVERDQRSFTASSAAECPDFLF